MSATSTEAGASDQGTKSRGELALYLVTVELRGDGEPRIVGLVCEARSRSLAEQIAGDVHEDEPHVYLRSVRRLDELQIVHPLTWGRPTRADQRSRMSARPRTEPGPAAGAVAGRPPTRP